MSIEEKRKPVNPSSGMPVPEGAEKDREKFTIPRCKDSCLCCKTNKNHKTG